MRCIVIGGNAAGMSAAAKLMRSEQDVQLTVYEQSEIVSYGACGLPYYIADYFSDINTVLSRS
jgi:NADPH-dependent 2,4-dienoyl-CoA reductase/sulfur reductase-like enzyme